MSADGSNTALSDTRIGSNSVSDDDNNVVFNHDRPGSINFTTFVERQRTQERLFDAISHGETVDTQRPPTIAPLRILNNGCTYCPNNKEDGEEYSFSGSVESEDFESEDTDNSNE